ncbi:MAG: phosphatidylglycerol lysyltransferase domain-containing protein, partial [Desulfovibrionaceae bacterium]|nr:phosphatidylglycerol lysyltransferase domain-containing protein [Desulfovibrionaceae bacterium]
MTSVFSRACGHSTDLSPAPAPFTPDLAPAYGRCYAAMSTHPICYSPANLWAWAGTLQVDIRLAAGLAWLRYRQSDGLHATAPVGDWAAADWRALEPELLGTGRFDSVTEDLLAIWRQQLSCRIEVTECRDAWEYLCHAADLAEYPGTAFRRQRRQVRLYVRECGEPDLRPLEPGDSAAMLALSRRWLAGRADRPDSGGEVDRGTEVEALGRLLAHWTAFGLTGMGLRLNGELAAFSLGARLDARTMGILYQKADPGIPGASQVILQAFARSAAKICPVLNLAEDLGLEGLRFFKTGLRPF